MLSRHCRKWCALPETKGLNIWASATMGLLFRERVTQFILEIFYVVPREIDGVKLLMGAELNILDYSGTLDLDSEYCCRLDYVIAGLHRVCYKAGSKRQTQMLFWVRCITPG